MKWLAKTNWCMVLLKLSVLLRVKPWKCIPARENALDVASQVLSHKTKPTIEETVSSHKNCLVFEAIGDPMSILLILFWEGSSCRPAFWIKPLQCHFFWSFFIDLAKTGAHTLFAERCFSCNYFTVVIVKGKSAFTDEEEGKGCNASVSIFSQVRAHNVPTWPYLYGAFLYISIHDCIQAWLKF